METTIWESEALLQYVSMLPKKRRIPHKMVNFISKYMNFCDYMGLYIALYAWFILLSWSIAYKMATCFVYCVVYNLILNFWVSIYCIIPLQNEGLDFLLSTFDTLYFLSSLIAFGNTCCTVLNRSGESMHLGLWGHCG